MCKLHFLIVLITLNRLSEISEICHKEGEPVYLTREGKGDLVVMSVARYEKQMGTFRPLSKISAAE